MYVTEMIRANLMPNRTEAGNDFQDVFGLTLSGSQTIQQGQETSETWYREGLSSWFIHYQSPLLFSSFCLHIRNISLSCSSSVYKKQLEVNYNI